MITLDRESLLVHVDGAARFADVEAYLAERGLTLDATYEGTVREWIEAGAPGARNAWLDPADHLVAGFSTPAFAVRPAPRRATGPDLFALVAGLRGRLLPLESVWLRVHRAPRPSTEEFEPEEEPLGADERALFDAIADELKK